MKITKPGWNIPAIGRIDNGDNVSVDDVSVARKLFSLIMNEKSKNVNETIT